MRAADPCPTNNAKRAKHSKILKPGCFFVFTPFYQWTNSVLCGPPSQATVTISGKVQETPCSQGSTFKDRLKDRRKEWPTLASMRRSCPRPALASMRRSCRPTNQNEGRPKPRPTPALMRRSSPQPEHAIVAMLMSTGASCCKGWLYHS